ncbi:hypothetical protein NGM10_00910 [Halorussus salilacus]|uniref:hypothetical protein n=1 Tax=Halorussus salilacus TaxID=2953750 RepID=UPI00209CCA06|nr:hypothetical protein [Halorussus salilacus]USZ68316.1 hypothetical protein NGM10_00910 [Halorussus salilacus]
MPELWIYGDKHTRNHDVVTEEIKNYLPEDVEIIFYEGGLKTEPSVGRWVHLLNPMYVLLKFLIVPMMLLQQWRRGSTGEAAGVVGANNVASIFDTPVRATDLHHRDKILKQGPISFISIWSLLLFSVLIALNETISGALFLLVIGSLTHRLYFSAFIDPVRERKMVDDITEEIIENKTSKVALVTGSAHVRWIEKLAKNRGFEVHTERRDDSRLRIFLRSLASVPYGRYH